MSEYRRNLLEVDYPSIKYTFLPSGLTFNGSEYIATELYPNYDWNFRVMAKQGVCDKTMFLFGSRNTDSRSASKENCLSILSSNYLRRDFYGSYASVNASLTSLTYNRRFFARRNVGVVTSASNYVATATAVSSGVCSYPMFICALNNVGTPIYGFNGTLREFTAYDYYANVLINLIPVTDNNGVDCMFDSVSNKFFYKQNL